MIIFDIDGVLADVTQLLPLIDSKLPKDKRDYEQYYARLGEAEPIERGIYLLQRFKNHKVVMLTGRRFSSEAITRKWLNKYTNLRHKPKLYMRLSKDLRPAHEVKRDLIRQIKEEHGIARYEDMIVVEDDPRNAKMFRSLGCFVLRAMHEKGRSE